MKLTDIELRTKFRTWTEELGDDEDYGTCNDAIAHGDFDETKIVAEFGPIKYSLTDQRGSSGDHDSCETVIYFEEHDVYLSLEGWYSSHDGSNYEEEEWQIVFPHVITKTVFRKEPQNG